MPLSGRAIDLPRPFGPFTLLRRLATGGMAEVYVAKARGLGGFEKLVAIKLIHPRLSEDEHFVQMLVEEAKLSVLLTHANIGQTFDLGRVEAGPYFIVMEYIEGADASRLLQRLSRAGRRLPLDVAAFIMSEVCQGLDYAHRKRDMTGAPLHIVHRDISPQNVLISLAGQVKIVDFGIAKAAMRSAQTEVGVIKGKYYYMSPEQAWADPVDHRSDIFSAGVVLHELLTGEMLYQGKNLPELMDRVRKAENEPPSRRRPEIPPELDAIVMKALAKHPSERFRSAGEFGQALARFLHATSPGCTAARLASLMAEFFGADTALPEDGDAPPTSEADDAPRAREERPSPTESAVEEWTGSLEAMRPEEFRPDVTKSVLFDLQEFDGEATRDEKRRRLLPAIEPDDTDDDRTIVQGPFKLWEESPPAVSPGRAAPGADGGPPEIESWGDTTTVDDRDDVLRRMREALEREVAERNRVKRQGEANADGGPLPPRRSGAEAAPRGDLGPLVPSIDPDRDDLPAALASVAGSLRPPAPRGNARRDRLRWVAWGLAVAIVAAAALLARAL